MVGGIIRALLGKRTKRGSWIYLLWLWGYGVLAFTAIAYAGGFGLSHLPSVIVLSVSAILAFIQFRYPTVLGWALITVASFFFGFLALLVFLMMLPVKSLMLLAAGGVIACLGAMFVYALIHYRPFGGPANTEADSALGDHAASVSRKGTPLWVGLALSLNAGLAVFIGAVMVWWFGAAFEFEYPFWATLWVARQTKTPDGHKVTDLVLSRSGHPQAREHWHHCGFCDDVYPHTPHMAVQVTVNDDEDSFLLFDWDLAHGKLLPASVRTATLFPELIPPGYSVKPLGLGLNPQLYHNDQPCLIVIESSSGEH